MNPSMFALVHRSLRIDSRSTFTYVLRTLAVLLGVLGVVAAHEAGPIGEPGLQLFRFLVWINLILISFGSASVFATVITEEKEDMTLGLLRMTGLSPLNILLGKSAGRLLSALFFLLVQIPLVVLAVSFGGASVEQVLCSYTVLGAYIVFVAGIGLLASVVTKSNKAAAGLVVTILIVLWLVPIFVSGLITMLGFSGSGLSPGGFVDRFVVPSVEFLWSVSPYREAARILGIDFQGGVTPNVLWFLLIGAFVSLIGAWLIFRKTRVFDHGVTAVRSLTLERLIRRRKSRPVWAFPVVWKDFYYLAGGRLAVVVKLLVYGVVGFGLAYILSSNNSYLDYREAAGGTLCNIGWIGFTIELGVLCGRIFREEIKAQTLSGLVTLPRPMIEWVFEKAVGCALTLLPAVLAFIVGGLLVGDEFFDFAGELAEELGFWVVAMYFVAGFLLTVYLSLFLRWGAFAASLAICLLAAFIFTFAAFAIFNVRDEDAFAGFAGFLVFCIILGLLIQIPRRLRVVAAQG